MMSQHTIRAWGISWLLVGLTAAAASGQIRHDFRPDYDYFDRDGRRQGAKGWTVLTGGAGLLATPRASETAWVRAGLASDGSLTAPDTVYAGNWRFRGSGDMCLGVGRWKVLPEQGLIDRTGWLLTVGNQGVEEFFEGLSEDSLGVLRPDTIHHTGQVFNLRFQVHASRAFAISRDVYLDVRTGLGLHHDFDPSTRGVDSTLVGLTSLHQTRIGLDVGVGVGVRMWSGRHLRLMAGTRAFQLNAGSSTGRSSSFDWMAGTYRPWSIQLCLDLQQPRPATRCGETTGSVHQPGRNLFGPVMRKRYRWSN